jgi:hypothetical protein
VITVGGAKRLAVEEENAMKAIAEAGADRDRAGGGGRLLRGHPLRQACPGGCHGLAGGGAEGGDRGGDQEEAGGGEREQRV